MRIVRPLFVLLVALSLAAAALTYMEGYTDEHRIYIQPHPTSFPDHHRYNGSSYPGNPNPDAPRAATGNPDRYLQRY